MLRTVISLLLVGYLPGALGYRLPAGDRNARAALPSEERVFWYVVLSLAWTSVIAFSLAALGAYSFERVLWSNGILCALLFVALRWNVRLGATKVAPTWTAALPAALAIAGFSINFYVPPSEYIIGGRDPGVYMNVGVQIAQRGSLTMHDEVAAAVPEADRELFFPYNPGRTDFRDRFMGFFLLDPGTGAVVGRFPHLYPVGLAIGYGINGLTGVRWTHGFAAVLGLLAVYFAGTRLLGRAAAAAGAGLLALQVIQLWYARYPNAEIVMQPLAFAGLLAYVRAQFDGDRFFWPVSAVLLSLALFVHLTAAFLIAAVVAAALFEYVGGRRPSFGFALPLVAGVSVAVLYYVVVLPPYFAIPLGFVRELQPMHLALMVFAILLGVLVVAVARRPAIAVPLDRWLPLGVVALVSVAAAYAYFIRTAGGRLALHDADALRTFASFYLTPVGLAGALVGFFIASRRTASNGVTFLFAAAGLSLFFFYKIRIVPEHFWMTRRFLSVVLPSMLLLCGAAAFSPVPLSSRLAAVRHVLGAVFIAYLGWHFAGASAAILEHVEYAGVIPRLEALAGHFGDNDLVIVESRGASDVHVLAPPLAYVYAKHVLVLARMTPDKTALTAFLNGTRNRYGRIFFVGGGRTDLLSRRLAAEPIGSERFQIPEYEAGWNTYPRMVRMKQFEFGIYELKPGGQTTRSDIEIDVGGNDDLQVHNFWVKEQQPDGLTFRWTQAESSASIVVPVLNERMVTLWLSSGARPGPAGPADVQVFLNNQRLGSATVAAGFAPYRFSVPADLAAQMAQSDEPATLRLVSRTWAPSKFIGGSDMRELGVIVDRLEVR